MNNLNTWEDVNPSTPANMNVYTGNPENEGGSTLQNMSPAQFLISLDHVLEMILRSLNPTQLLKCRLLSHRWNSFASVFIRKRVEIIFYKQHPSTRNLAKSENILHKKLTELDSLPLYPQSLFPFPVNKFSFHFVDIYNSQVTRFLDIHGPHIQELALQSCVGQTEVQLMDFVATLLSKQTRNLEILTLNVRPTNIQWKTKMRNDEDYEDERYRLDDSTAPLLPKDPECFEIYSSFQYENPHSKLKVFQIDFQISAKIFEVIYRMSPRLEDLIIHSDYSAFLETPVNRAHVFKTFCSSLWSNYFSDDIMLEFLQFLNIKNRLQLRTIVLRGEDIYESYREENGWKRLVDVINYLFKISCNTLENLGWINLRFLKKKGIRWCRMPKLRHLTVGYYTEIGISSVSSNIFPMGFSPVTVFPQLETVQLCVHCKHANFLYFLNSLNFEPVPSVRVVDVRDESPDAIITLDYARAIKNLFPLARILTGKSCKREPNLLLKC